MGSGRQAMDTTGNLPWGIHITMALPGYFFIVIRKFLPKVKSNGNCQENILLRCPTHLFDLGFFFLEPGRQSEDLREQGNINADHNKSGKNHCYAENAEDHGIKLRADQVVETYIAQGKVHGELIVK